MAAVCQTLRRLHSTRLAEILASVEVGEQLDEPTRGRAGVFGVDVHLKIRWSRERSLSTVV